MAGFMSLAGRVAVVTGASRGIGQAIALQLAELGARVIGTATTPSGAAAIGQYLADSGYSPDVAQGMVLNVTDPESIANFFSAVKESFGNVDILVNNAGITRDNLLLRMKDDEWQDIIDTNLTSVFRLSKTVLRTMMKARFGRVINIGSVVGTMGNAGQVNYAAAKAGLLGFTKAMAREVASRGITVNAVAPGFIDTDMTKALNDAQRQDIFSQIPVGRLGEPKEIAAIVAFLASDSAAYITGETIHVNGGMVMS